VACGGHPAFGVAGVARVVTREGVQGILRIIYAYLMIGEVR
jgi:hypothetical protein